MTWSSYLPKEVSEASIIIPATLYFLHVHFLQRQSGTKKHEWDDNVALLGKMTYKSFTRTGPFPWRRCVSLARTCESLSQWILCRTFPSTQSSHCIPSQPQRPQRKSNDKGSSNRWEEVTGPPANSTELTLWSADRLSLSCCCIVFSLHVSICTILLDLCRFMKFGILQQREK